MKKFFVMDLNKVKFICLYLRQQKFFPTLAGLLIRDCNFHTIYLPIMDNSRITTIFNFKTEMTATDF